MPLNAWSHIPAGERRPGCRSGLLHKGARISAGSDRGGYAVVPVFVFQENPLPFTGNPFPVNPVSKGDRVGKRKFGGCAWKAGGSSAVTLGAAASEPPCVILPDFRPCGCIG